MAQTLLQTASLDLGRTRVILKASDPRVRPRLITLMGYAKQCTTRLSYESSRTATHFALHRTRPYRDTFAAYVIDTTESSCQVTRSLRR